MGKCIELACEGTLSLPITLLPFKIQKDGPKRRRLDDWSRKEHAAPDTTTHGNNKSGNFAAQFGSIVR